MLSIHDNNNKWVWQTSGKVQNFNWVKFQIWVIFLPKLPAFFSQRSYIAEKFTDNSLNPVWYILIPTWKVLLMTVLRGDWHPKKVFNHLNWNVRSNKCSSSSVRECALFINIKLHLIHTFTLYISERKMDEEAPGQKRKEGGNWEWSFGTFRKTWKWC